MDIVIIGAGIVGLHVARAFREQGHGVVLLEKEKYLAEHTSGRNSGVVHSGIYYEENSLQEKFCIEGNRLTHEWLVKLSVPHQKTGKWVIPVGNQSIESFYKKITALPIPKPQIKTKNEISKDEPRLKAKEAIFVPSTTFLDAATYVKNLAVFVASNGVDIIQPCRVTVVNGNRLETTRGPISFDLAINCAGLFCDEVAAMTGLSGYTIKPCRGDYYVINHSPLLRPVYHLPQTNDHALGIHFTPTVDRQMLIGPNAFFIDDKTNYHHQSDETDFRKQLDCDIDCDPLTPITKGFSGNRPRLFFNERPVKDFVFIKSENWIHCLGIESPGLTAAPAIAKHCLSPVAAKRSF